MDKLEQNIKTQKRLAIKRFYKILGIKQTFGERLDFSIGYNTKTLQLTITCRYDATTLLRREIQSSEVKDLQGYIETIANEVKVFLEEQHTLDKRWKSKISSHPLETLEFKFDNHRTGACKYRSIGYTRYAYFCLLSQRVHEQWTKIYFNNEKMFTDKIPEVVKKMREESVEGSHLTDRPPNVRIIHSTLESLGLEYIKNHESEIYEQLKNLPLNACDLREDMNYGAYLFVLDIVQGKKYLRIPIEGEVADPSSKLYLMLKHNSSQRDVQGFARAVNAERDGDTVYEFCKIITDAKFRTEVDIPLSLKNTWQEKLDNGLELDKAYVLIGKKTYSMKYYILGDPITKDDQYVAVIMKDILDKRNRGELKEKEEEDD